MDQPRQVSLKTVYVLAKAQPTWIKTSIWFLFISLFMLIFFAALLPTVASNVPSVDHAQINERGMSTEGTITGIETQHNVTINNQHPSIISYSYLAGEKKIESKFKTLDTDKVDRLSVGDAIVVKHLNGESTLPSLEPFDSEYLMFLFGPAILVLIAAIPFMIGVQRIRKAVRLYKYGTIADAEVLAIDRIQQPRLFYFFVIGFFKPSDGSKVNYQYKGASGKTYLNEVFTPDMLPANSLKYGDAIKIFISPEDESKSTLVPRLEAIRNHWKIER